MGWQGWLRLVLWGLAAGGTAQAQETPPAVSTEQRGGVYVPPPAQVDPVYLPTGPDAPPPREAVPPPLRLELAIDVPLRSGGSAALGRGVQGSTAASPTLQVHLRWLPLPGTPWFVRAGFHRYLRADRQQPWHPDFTYAFGYDDWRPGSFSLFYANYTGTRLRPDRAAGESRFNFPEGQWTLAYRFGLPPALAPWFLVGDGDRADCRAHAVLTPRYIAFSDGQAHRGKKALSAGCRYTRPDGWYAEADLFAWPRRGEQQPWDPDFTYGFGWARGGLVLRYSNYSGNRFAGRARGAGEGTFRSGSVSLVWATEW